MIEKDGGRADTKKPNWGGIRLPNRTRVKGVSEKRGSSGGVGRILGAGIKKRHGRRGM